MNARRVLIPIEMREADARGARKEVVALFKELCDLILSATRIEADIETGLSAAGVQVNDRRALRVETEVFRRWGV